MHTLSYANANKLKVTIGPYVYDFYFEIVNNMTKQQTIKTKFLVINRFIY